MLKKKWWIVLLALIVAVLGGLQACGTGGPAAAIGNVTFFGSGS